MKFQIIPFLGLVAARFANRKFVYSIAAVSLLAAKALHIYAHIVAFSALQIVGWGLSFFFQDVIILLALRYMLFSSIKQLRIPFTILSGLVVYIALTVATVNIGFYFVAGSELHWRNIGLASDSSSWGVLFTGLFSLGVTGSCIILASWFTQDLTFFISTVALDILQAPFVWVYQKLPMYRNKSVTAQYDHIPQEDIEIGGEKLAEENISIDDELPMMRSKRSRRWLLVALYILVGIAVAVQFITYAAQPREKSYTFMSWAVPLLPVMDFVYSAPSLASVLLLHANGTAVDIGNRTALAEPIPWTWLPERKDEKLAGFEDWYSNATHYRADHDPLRISNLNDPLLSELSTAIKDVDIRHVMIIKLESTRKDTFPIKAHDLIWEKLERSFKNKSLSPQAQARLATLTPIANYLTGDYDDGFPHESRKKRGGLNVKNAHTTGTYTLKSLTGTLCGITPLVADFNIEYLNHIYQPCLAQIFDAFNEIDHSHDQKNAKEYMSYKWKTSFMQSTTGGYDKQDLLMPFLGYPGEKFLQGEYLKSDDAKFGKLDLPDVNYYGMPEVAIEDYLNDIFKQAKEKNERLFLTHLTSTAHHPFGIPEDAGFVKLNEEDGANDLSSYTNAIGYVDGWLGKVLDILDKQGVANETLIVLVGDHGLSIAETGAVTPYYQPNIGNFHVPLVVSHPAMPAIDIDGPANSIQILPTILDLLLSTESLSQSEAKAASDLVHNYEGQSLIRPMRNSSETVGGWQFTVMNTGRAQLAVRDARYPDWRIIVPIVDNIAWRFTDLEKDPHESDATEDFGFSRFTDKVFVRYGADAAAWVEQAAYVAKWWVDDNAKRYRYSG